MADPSDKSLLDRLNALKPTSVAFGTSSNALGINTTGIPPAEPLSREDALAKRLRTLRNQREKAYQESQSEEPPPPYTEATDGASSSFTTTQPPLGSPSPAIQRHAHVDPPSTTNQLATQGPQEQEDGDEDRALDEIFDTLVIEDDHWSLSGDEDIGDSKQVEELLATLRQDPGAKLPSSPPGKRSDDHGTDDEDDDDHSEGDNMSKQVDRILARTMDELNLDPTSTDQPVTESAKDPEDYASGTSPKDYGDISHPDLSLPTVPQDTEHRTTNENLLPDLPTTPHDLEATTASNSNPGLILPTVPTALIDPAPSNTTADPFESSIANRLAALKGPGHKPLTTDAFGLPSVPTSPPTVEPALLRTKAGYTDADQKTWCVICLEDATVRCLGCADEGDGEVYCARCWREMHVGPAAGYDERGHAWEKFDPRRRM